jgi:hypothetical protein
MKKITGYIKEYFNETDKLILLLVSLFTALLIFCNYYFDIDGAINHQASFTARFGYRYFISVLAFWVPYVLCSVYTGKKYFNSAYLVSLVVLAPAIFVFKMVMPSGFNISGNESWDHYWNQVIYWPFRLLVMTAILFPVWKFWYRKEPFFGLTTKNFEWRPYALMLFAMMPLIALASAQPDFLAVYPKLKMVNDTVTQTPHSWFYKWLFELSYGTDFVSIELFFRGFLILAFVKWAGKDAILPMACFYCTVHFGKPIGECISSYFGGILLGIVVYNTRSIFGGLIVHLGIAWLMELGGYIGNMYQ